MKRIALSLCAVLLVVSNAAAANWYTRTSGGTYSQPARVAPASYRAYAGQSVQANTAAYSTRSAQGVANLMASHNRVGHWGGNPGYEGCGAGSSPAAAYNNCCYSRSGMATVDVGYARGANGTWFCCRRYR